MSETPILSPAPKTPRRLNNLALVLLSLAGSLLLATVVYFVSLRPAPPARGTTPAPHPESVPVEPGFYRQPPRAYPAVPAAPRSGGPDPAEMAALEALARTTQAPGSPSTVGDPRLGVPPPAAYGAPGASGTPYAAPPPPPPADPRREAYQRALHAPISISAPTATMSGGGGSPGPQGLGLGALPALRIPGLTEPLAGEAPREVAAADPTTTFLTSARTPRDPRLSVTLDPPASGTQLDAGSLIPAVLATGINSDLPGDLVAQVTRDVFDSRTERQVLIPRGSRLLGRYQNQVAAGQHRLLVAWDRLIFPDGTSLRFPGLPGASPSGEAGLPGAVDNHLSTVFGSALLLSLLSAGVQLSQPQESATFGQAASARQVGAAALGQELSTVGVELLRRRMAIPPTLRIPAGTEFSVFVRSDLVLPAYR